MSDSPDASPSPHHRWKWFALLLLVVPALLRTLIVITPNPYFAMDPREFLVPLEGVGPLGSTFLDALSILGLSLALFIEYRSGRAPDAKCILLALIPVPVLFYHALQTAENAFHASNWLAALATAIGALHLARDPRMRRSIIVLAMALVAPLIVKAIFQITLEHALTVDAFNTNRDAILRSRGWEPDSAAARAFVRRLTQREATGYFALSNVLGSVFAGFAAFWVTNALNAARSRASSGIVALSALFAFATLVGLAATFSKGAIAAGLIGIMLALLSTLPPAQRRYLTRNAPRIAILFIFTALIVTVLRGALLGQGGQSLDGYSLLFRYQYWLGAMKMFAQHLFTGVGPADFQNAYIIHRPPLSPEEVASAHSVFIDWLATLGITAIAWIMLSFILLVRSAPLAAATTDPPHTPSEHASHDHPRNLEPSIFHIVITALLTIGVAWYLNRFVFMLEFHALGAPISILLFIAAATLLASLAQQIPPFLARWSLWALLTIVFLHSQIEVTLTQPGSAALIFLILGAAASHSRPRTPSPDASTPARAWPALVAVILLLAHLTLIAYPTWQRRSHLHAAYIALAPVGQLRSLQSQLAAADDLQTQSNAAHEAQLLLAEQSIDLPLDRMMREISTALRSGNRDQAQRLLANLALLLDDSITRLERSAIDQALTHLQDAADRMPESILAQRTLIRYHVVAATLDKSAASDHLAAASDLAVQFTSAHPDLVAAHNLAAQAFEARFAHSIDPAHLDAAIDHAARAADLDQYSVTVALKLAELLDQAGRAEQAIAAYERTLTNSENMRLDPLKMLTPDQARAIQARILELSR